MRVCVLERGTKARKRSEREKERAFEKERKEGVGPKKLMSLDFGEHTVDDVKMDVNGTSTSIEFHQHNQQI